VNTQRTCLSCKSKEYSLRALVDQSLSLFLPPSAAYATQYASLLAYNPPLLCDSNHVTVLPPYAAQSVYSPVGTVESHPISKLKRDASEHQMIDSNSRPEGQIRKENRVGSSKSREMRPSEAARTSRHWSTTLPMPNRKYVSIRDRNATTPSHPSVQGAGHYV